MLTKTEFFKKKFFLKESIIEIRLKHPFQIPEIDFWKSGAEYKAIQSIKSYFLRKKRSKDDLFNEEVNFDFASEIAEWRIRQKPVCHYCGLTEAALPELNKQPGHNNKRWPKRGKSLEIDRKQPDLPYSRIDNLALVCYWCNNAKTDTFTYVEFKEIGKIINAIWEKRLGKKLPIPSD